MLSYIKKSQRLTVCRDYIDWVIHIAFHTVTGALRWCTDIANMLLLQNSKKRKKKKLTKIESLMKNRLKREGS